MSLDRRLEQKSELLFKAASLFIITDLLIMKYLKKYLNLTSFPFLAAL